MDVNLTAFAEALPPGSRVCLDTALLIYHLEDVAPYAALTASLLTRLGEGELIGLVSTVTVTELLAKPFSLSDPRKATDAEHFLETLPNCAIHPVTYETARTAAQLRARSGLRTPDALIAATALGGGATHLVTNDPVLRRVFSGGVNVVVLDDYLIRN